MSDVFFNSYEVDEYLFCIIFRRGLIKLLLEPRYEKTGFLHMEKQRRRSASRLPRS